MSVRAFFAAVDRCQTRWYAMPGNARIDEGREGDRKGVPKLANAAAQSMTELDLIRFIDAQAAIYDQVVDELNAGRKASHWMWFIFPQLAGLGRSAMAQRYAIRDLDEARRYLADPILGSRLRRCVRLMLHHAGASATEILGSPDDLKFRSCVTLFREAAADEADRSLFAQALKQFYAGEPDRRTLELLRP
jgi:uncharacterized protein (DUF1810 family)